ncbi:3-hydroxyacyl-CoA dehydrogenase family protein [Microbacterium pseudoresistens]|uniref:3-hydroxybutyryl-CoA dehydrogenase n=1 Tax=Microbacterium pseudoresistens TaxID=640634 RepID=A0A7Y9EVM6_9MICO|nr:3-hydroxyacyl-CoA dehydrogenase family protein [Microbacterium pseudoresistens]NYD54795.1 3-hydroxybutyryl-CoA dehydrogenase [Microbacterium pseudoresistens]
MSAAAPAPEAVGVIGGGRMGSGIAHAFLMAGSTVRLVERDAESSGRAREAVRRALARSAEHGSAAGMTAMAAPDDVLDERFTIATDLDALAGYGLVIEAVPEDHGLKHDALTRAASVLADDAVLATNTSSMSIDALAAGLARPQRFLGLHFFNPVPASALVEIVRGAATDESVIARCRGWIDALGKSAVVVRDSPGFASSRLGVALGLEAIRMLEEGVASAADIDTAMVRGYRHPLGPLRTTDLVGLEVRLAIAEQLATTLGARFEPPALLRRMVAEGRLGRKSGQGFYHWDEEER